MADPRDDRVSSAYRELPVERPTPALDAAIQAAARRAVGSRPGGARRWQIPVSIAAVLALAVGISLNVDREKPMVVDGTPVSSGSAEYPVVQAAPDKEERAAPAMAERAAAANQSAAPARQVTAALPPAPAPVAAPPPLAKDAPTAMSAETMRVAPQAARRAKSEVSGEAPVQQKMMSGAPETPEKRLERIAELRTGGLHDEADRALAEFRRAYPDYRISDEWLRKVQR